MVLHEESAAPSCSDCTRAPSVPHTTLNTHLYVQGKDSLPLLVG